MPRTITTALHHPPQMNRNLLMRMHEREAEACLMAFNDPAGVPADSAVALALVANAHAQLAVHYSPRPRKPRS